MCAPNRNIYMGFMNEMHITEESCTRIPATTLLAVLEANSNFVVANVQSGCDVTMKSIIAIWPEAHFLSIDKDFGFAHSAIEEEEIIGRCRW